VRRLWGFAMALYHRVMRDDIGAYAAALTYNLLFALFPLILAIAALVPPTVRPALVTPLSHVVSPEVIALLRRTAGAEKVHPTLAYAGALGYVWGMSGAFRRLMDAFNHAYEFPRPLRRRTWQTIVLSLVLALTLGVLLVVAMVVAAGGQYLVAAAAGPAGLRAAVLVAIRWAILLAMAGVMLAVLYAVAPDRPQHLRWVSPGGATAICAWLVISFGFSQYLTHFNSYNVLYGSVGAVILLLLYLYFLSWTLLLGAEINAMLGVGYPPAR
jgi:membrane protein